MKNINKYIQEKYLIDIDVNSDEDEWVLMDAPHWSNYDRKSRDTFLNEFKNRYFDIYSNIGTWMYVMIIKLSELNKAKKILGYRNKPAAYELPDQLSINASSKEIKEYALKHSHNQNLGKEWLYDNLKRVA